MFKFFVFSFFFFLNLKAQTFSIAKFSIGESRIKINQDEFAIKHNSNIVRAQFISDTVQWIRNDANLLAPRSLMAIGILNDKPNIELKYFGKNIFPVKRSNYYYAEFYVDLFTPGEIKVFKNGIQIDTITIEPIESGTLKSKQLVDYSCSPYNLKVEGVDNEYLSIGCKMDRVGKLFHEFPRLEVTISSPNLKTISHEAPPFTLYLKDNTPIEFNVISSDNREQTLKIEAQLPKQLTRLKTALGFGPYTYQSFDLNQQSKNKWALSMMIYGKYELTPTSSFKAFDALLYAKSFFNNSGLYFSYDLAEAFDGRVLMNTLLGLQGLHYRYDKNSKTEFRYIYPQGFEVIYKHAFGLINRNLTYGMFFSTSTSEPYTNAWIRFGGKVFWELNYIGWKYQDKKISMAGFSVGFPFFEAL